MVCSTFYRKSSIWKNYSTLKCWTCHGTIAFAKFDNHIAKLLGRKMMDDWLLCSLFPWLWIFFVEEFWSTYVGGGVALVNFFGNTYVDGVDDRPNHREHNEPKKALEGWDWMRTFIHHGWDVTSQCDCHCHLARSLTTYLTLMYVLTLYASTYVLRIHLLSLLLTFLQDLWFTWLGYQDETQHELRMANKLTRKFLVYLEVTLWSRIFHLQGYLHFAFAFITWKYSPIFSCIFPQLVHILRFTPLSSWKHGDL